MTIVNLNRTLLTGVLAVIVLSLSSSAFAHPHTGHVMISGHTHEPQTEIIPLDSITSLEKTTILFHVPDNNELPWGFVEGKVANHVEGYPVIIQIFKNGEAAHFAQTDIKEDGSYEYKFRVQNSEKGQVTKLFDGDYVAKIFKVVYTLPENLI